jgi:hypothetical protein
MERPGRASIRSESRDRTLSAPVYILHSFLPFIVTARFGRGWLNKKPAIDLAIAGFSEICLFRLEVSSHDASGAVPSGHQSLDDLALANRKRSCHI